MYELAEWKGVMGSGFRDAALLVLANKQDLPNAMR